MHLETLAEELITGNFSFISIQSIARERQAMDRGSILWACCASRSIDWDYIRILGVGSFSLRLGLFKYLIIYYYSMCCATIPMLYHMLFVADLLSGPTVSES